jgi:hypothetical protein
LGGRQAFLYCSSSDAGSGVFIETTDVSVICVQKTTNFSAAHTKLTQFPLFDCIHPASPESGVGTSFLPKQ